MPDQLDDYYLLSNAIRIFSEAKTNEERLRCVMRGIYSHFESHEKCNVFLYTYVDQRFQIVDMEGRDLTATNEIKPSQDEIGFPRFDPAKGKTQLENIGITSRDNWPESVNDIRPYIKFAIRRNGEVTGIIRVEYTAPDSSLVNNFDMCASRIVIPYIYLLTLQSSATTDSDDLMTFVRKQKEKNVLILGKDTGPELALLHKIRDGLGKCGIVGQLVKEHPDIPSMSNEEKVRMFADHARFVVLENSHPAGQIAELKMCVTNRIVTATLRKKGQGSSFMVTDYDLDFSFVKEFEYDSDESIQHAVKAAVEWSDAVLKKRAEHYDKLYPWRTQEKIPLRPESDEG